MKSDTVNGDYVPTIGLEIHAELKTFSKMFCPCKNDTDEKKPNINICPICLGHPGTLPVLNKEAIRHVLKVGVAVGGTLADFTEWDRKNYFYPDIPKGYQISQYKYPLVVGGKLYGVEIERIHLEEDTARSTHDQNKKSLVDFNRSGVPLMELVTMPVIHDALTAVNFAKELQLLLRYLGAGESNLEKGEMRVEANISVSSPEDMKANKFGTKTEVKNLNSFRSVERAIVYEVERQIELIKRGEKVIQETRGWDDRAGETYSQRSKESSHDYRYFPDPDIPKMKLSELPEFSVATLMKELPKLPWVARERLKKDYGMTDKEVAVFVESPIMTDYFKSIVAAFPDDNKRIKLTINYLLTDFVPLLRADLESSRIQNRTIADAGGETKEKSLTETLNSLVKPDYFASLISMIANSEISSAGAKKLLAIMIRDTNSTPKTLAEKHGLLQKSDVGDLAPAIEKVIADNAKVVAEYKAGKIVSLQFLIGAVMKATKGAANPTVVNKLLIEKLGK